MLVFDHCTQLSQDEVAQWLDSRVDADAAPAGVADIRANVDQAEFTRALHRIHDYIVAGDTYQVNYTYRLRFDAFGSPLALYARLRARQPVPYGALVTLPDGGALLSLSPELFVRHAQGELTARPMKGTAPAAPPEQTAENARRATALAADPKNRAENLMIVDLLRNDIGRIAVTGSVKVPALFEVTRYSSVLQMTSTVQARLRDDASLADIFQALYPCGSITGAPKRRTMEIIAELEPAPRGIYTGAIGWFDPPAAGAAHAVGDFCMSVPIRTLALQPAGPDGIRRGEMGVGAGIVLDSDPHEEFAECQLKARFLTGLTQRLRTVRDPAREPRPWLPPAGAPPGAPGRLLRLLRFCLGCRRCPRRAAGGLRGTPRRCPFPPAPGAAPGWPVHDAKRRAQRLAGDGQRHAGARHNDCRRPVPAPQEQRARALRRGLARGRGARRLRHAVL